MLSENIPQPASMVHRQPAAGVIGQNPMYGAHHNNAGRYHRSATDPMFYPPQHAVNGNTNGNTNEPMQALAENFGRVNLQAQSYHTSTKQNPVMTSQHYDAGVPLGAAYSQPYMQSGQLMYGNLHHAMANGYAGGYNMYPGYVNASQFPYSQNLIGGHSPMSSGWAPSSRVPSAEVPSLITPRRDSSSSQEGDAPGTPLTHYTGQGDYHNGIGVVGRSPHGMYSNWTTPSPTQGQFPKHQHRSSISPRLQLLVQQEPAIPHAIPAPYSPVKPLDRSLENPHGITNVYIRGLLPDTTDERLAALASRFGDITTHKSIIDHATGQCKGFGFVKFYNFKDAEDCIRGFHHLGYESSFARESFYSQLKKLHDDDNTNLYVSNLPKEYNEADLSAVFKPHKVCSSRILRDGHGNGRGVGFARFQDRNVCDVIIQTFNNKPVESEIDGEQYLIQIRFADTPEQKQLKQQTTAARQYRTAEYESVTQGRTPFLSPARLSNGSMTNLGPHPSQVRPGFETYHQDFEGYMKGQSGGMRSSAYGTAHSRLSNVSSHLGTPQDTVINTKLPEPAKAHSGGRATVADVNIKTEESVNDHPEEAATSAGETGVSPSSSTSD